MEHLLSIFGGLKQRRAPCRNVIILEDPSRRGPFYRECLNVDRSLF